MKLESIVKALAAVIASSLLVATSSLAQEATGWAGSNPKIAELNQVPGKGAGAQPAAQGGQPAGKGTAGRQTQIASKGIQLSLVAPAAAQPVARLRAIDGNALVSNELGLVAGDHEALLKEGTRVIATSNTKLIVAFLDGCEIRLESNQRIELSTAKPCSERIYDVKSILIESTVALGSTGGITSAALGGSLQAAGALGGLAGAANVVKERIGETVSPN